MKNYKRKNPRMHQYKCLQQGFLYPIPFRVKEHPSDNQCRKSCMRASSSLLWLPFGWTKRWLLYPNAPYVSLCWLQLLEAGWLVHTPFSYENSLHIQIIPACHQHYNGWRFVVYEGIEPPYCAFRQSADLYVTAEQLSHSCPHVEAGISRPYGCEAFCLMLLDLTSSKNIFICFLFN